jgi:hypothetical protein
MRGICKANIKKMGWQRQIFSVTIPMEKFTSCLFFVAVVVGVMNCPLDKQKCCCHLCGYSKPVEIQIIVHNLFVF